MNTLEIAKIKILNALMIIIDSTSSRQLKFNLQAKACKWLLSTAQP
jgi:hypothetical protein